MVHLRIAGYLCGLGEIGWSKMLITPEFGPAVRVGLIFTEMEPDPIYDGPKLCNRCMACVRACPGHYIKGSDQYRPNAISPFYQAPPKVYNAGKAVCGSGGCTRACLASLEARGVLTRKMKKPFRRYKPWKVDWSNYEEKIKNLPA